LVISLYYSNMTQSKFLEFLGILVFPCQQVIYNLLIKTTRTFILRKVKSMKRDLLVVLGSTLTKQLPVLRVNYTTNIVCNPIYTVYFTTEKKDRLTVLRDYKTSKNSSFFSIHSRMTSWRLSKFPKNPEVLKLLPQETEFSDLDFNTLLDNHLPKLGSTTYPCNGCSSDRFYHHQTDWPVVQALICDDASIQITPELALCWVHEGRHYKS